MPRLRKTRRIEHVPALSLFNPAGQPPQEAGEVRLMLDELEAIRLKDLVGLRQEECAARMRISRATYQRILMRARKQVAEALVQGKSIRIDGGDYVLAERE